ncbi:MAG: HNH endonuclease [Prosthecobacter sp.]|uniref:HNH endonuclease n=1 Tax=Prosthecobacter sp. TaxID=1965333 RepID=UPI0039016C26
MLRRQVTQRAKSRCEYCKLSQAGQEAIFHIDHIIPEMDGGATTLDNLALACVSCSLRKGARQVANDPVTGTLVRLFHPRLQIWQDHFKYDGVRAVGLTPVGRATLNVLKMNRLVLQAIRAEESMLGRHPPPLD